MVSYRIMVLICIWGVLLGACTPLQATHTAQMITGIVLSLNGTPVSGALVSTVTGQALSDAHGRFQLASQPGVQWITAKHPQFLARTRAASPGIPILMRLTPDDGETITLRFAGDTMAGRRFYDLNEDGDQADGLLKQNAGVNGHLALLHDIQPLLEQADITAVNLETPLIQSHLLDITQPRPEHFHPMKEYAFASDPSLATALKAAGVDVVDLGNNHLYDALDAGVQETLDVTQQAGLHAFGAGLTEAQAWAPAVVEAHGQQIAFLGCTTITGNEHAISYVASDLQTKGGAAACSEEMIRRSIETARARYATVIMMIHGGYEYARVPSENIQKLTATARAAGATLIINHHPHVVGSFNWNQHSLVAWTMGNFLFDQTVWTTLESYMLTVDLRHGQVLRAYIDPLMIQDFTPQGLVGAQAEYVAREAAANESGPYVIENNAMEIDTQGLATSITTHAQVEQAAGVKLIAPVPSSWWVSGFSGSGTLRLGRDRLWVGDFEASTTDDRSVEGTLWALGDSDKTIAPAYAYEGNAGIRLRRTMEKQGDSVLTHRYRILIDPHSELSAIGMIRASRNARVTVQISWYNDTRGPSQSQTVTALTLRDDNAWTPFQINATAPDRAVAVSLIIRLQPPDQGYATADLDSLKLIEWADPHTTYSPRYDYIQVQGSGAIALTAAVLPGAEHLIDRPLICPLGSQQALPLQEQP